MESPELSYIRHDASVSLGKANLYALFTIVPPVVLLVVLFTAIWGPATWVAGLRSIIHLPLVWLALFLAGVVVHELMHAATWLYYGEKSWQSIKFGFDLKTATPYAHCMEPMTVSAYRKGAAAPGLFLGILPSAVGILTGNSAVMSFGTLFTLAAGGDFLILWLLRSASPELLVEDHPSRAGCYLLEPVTEQLDEDKAAHPKGTFREPEGMGGDR